MSRRIEANPLMSKLCLQCVCQSGWSWELELQPQLEKLAHVFPTALGAVFPPRNLVPKEGQSGGVQLALSCLVAPVCC